ncbi:hypothetical protein VTN00DRAFT_5955 [Thermoascus crustaceus]
MAAMVIKNYPLAVLDIN